MAKEKQERLTDQNNPPLYDIRDIKKQLNNLSITAHLVHT